MTLAEYLGQAAQRPWRWGWWDCCTFVAGWVIERGHLDPMAFIRGNYDSERSALRRIRQGGGLVALWTRGMIDAGVPAVCDPQPGDVGVIRATTIDGLGEACGICTGERWLTLGIRGIEAAPASPLAIWRP